MDTIHIFISTGRFRSLDEIRAYIDYSYTEDGDAIPSEFGNEIRLSTYEPMCIEAIISESGQPLPLADLLAGASYGDQWLPKLDSNLLADSAICIFSPNEVSTPGNSSLEYLGKFEFNPELL